MKTTHKTCLFGGALFAAGLAASADAQQFQFSDSFQVYGFSTPSMAHVGAGYYIAEPFSYGITAESDAYAPDDLNLSVTSASGATTTSTTVTSNLLRFESTWDGSAYDGSYFKGFLHQGFQVDQEGVLTLSWDMSGTDFFGTVVHYIVDGYDTPIHIDSMNATGSIDIQVSPGTDYAVILNGHGAPFGYDTNTKFMQAALGPIPAPGAFALLGMAGLIGHRRRRH